MLKRVMIYLVLFFFCSSIIFASGWHFADEIYSGNFSGNYTFKNKVSFGPLSNFTDNNYIYIGYEFNRTLIENEADTGLYNLFKLKDVNENGYNQTANALYSHLIVDKNSSARIVRGGVFLSQVYSDESVEYIRGVEGHVYNYNNGTSTQMAGIVGTAHNFNGTVTNTYGASIASYLRGNGSINNAFGVNSFIRNDGTGTITTGYAYRANCADSETCFGLHIIAGDPEVTTDWGVYSIGEDKNYFSGNVGIGTTTPIAKLSVAGNITAEFICDETGTNCKDISTGWDGGENYKHLTMGIEGSFHFCAVNDASSVGCGTTDGWPVVCHRTASDYGSSADSERFAGFTIPAASWRSGQWYATGRGVTCTGGIVMFNPVESSGKATPTNLKYCGKNDASSVGCRVITDGWPVVCLRSDSSYDYNRGGWMPQTAYFSGGQWLGVVRGSGGPCTYGVWFWDYKE